MQFPAQAAGRLVAEWKFDETNGLTAADSVEDSAGRLEGFPDHEGQWVQGRVGGALSLNSDGTSNETVIVLDRPALNFTNRAFSFALWARSATQQSQSAGLIAKGYGGGGEEYALDVQAGGGTYRFFIRDNAGVSWPLVTSVHLSGRWQHLAATYDGAAARMNVYVDGSLAASAPGPKDLQFTGQPLSIGNRRSGSNTVYDLPFRGILDDVRFFDYALSAGKVKKLYEECGPLPPVFYTLPQNASYHTGEVATFTAIADGTGPLAYQWLKKGVYLPGATTVRLQISDLRFADDGIYTLQVSDTNNTSISASAVLTVAPYYWQTWWFIALVIVAAMLTVAAVVGLLERARARQALKQMEGRLAVDRERMRIARDMHDEIGGKLSRISLLSEMARRSLPESSVGSRQISEVSNATQDIIRTVDEIVWAVNPRHDNINSIVNYIRRHAEEFFELTAVELELNQPPELPERQVSAEVRHHLFCAVKEALNNVLKHAGAQKVRIQFTCAAKSFGIKIQDDGRGFDRPPAGAAALNGSARHGSGVDNTTDRMKTIGGEYKLTSARGQGAMVELIIPLE